MYNIAVIYESAGHVIAPNLTPPVKVFLGTLLPR